MFKRALIILATLVALVAAGFVAAAPASAEELCAPAGTRRVCVWTNQTASGTPTYYWTIPTGIGGVCFNFGSAINDKIRSWAISPGPRSATMKQHAGCSGSANSFIDQVYDSDYCWTSSWWPGCGSSLSQGSSIWVLKS